MCARVVYAFIHVCEGTQVGVDKIILLYVKRPFTTKPLELLVATVPITLPHTVTTSQPHTVRPSHPHLVRYGAATKPLKGAVRRVAHAHYDTLRSYKT